MSAERVELAEGPGCVLGAHGGVPVSAHTPTPWRVENGTILIWGNCTLFEDGVLDRLGKPVAECCRKRSWARGPDCMGDDEPDANAALIVRAVNAHADLVAALREARNYVWSNTGGNFWKETLARIDAALAKANTP